MLVSIAISTYEANGNGKNLLTKNLQEIFSQDYPNIEIVISDHSKNDEIKDVVERFNGNKYPIKYYRETEKRGNISYNINNAIKHCTGDYIKIMFMDDYLSVHTAISDIVKEFEKNKNAKWLVCSYTHTYDYKKFERKINPRFNPRMCLGINTIGSPSCLTFCKEVTERFDTNIKWYMDCDLYHRLFYKYGQPITYYKSRVVNLLHDNQVTNTEVDEELKYKEDEYIHKKYKTYLKFLKSINK